MRHGSTWLPLERYGLELRNGGEGSGADGYGIVQEWIGQERMGLAFGFGVVGS